MVTNIVLDRGLIIINQIVYMIAHTSCMICELVCIINTNDDKPTEISTALARTFAGQWRGFTARIRHLLSKISAAASSYELILTSTKTSTGKSIFNNIWTITEKPFAGLILDLMEFIWIYYYARFTSVIFADFYTARFTV